jgi:23S rRNA (guanine2445-N2)-methyltransferase / 23S rRNA (guanine2069-N7)-methyltransferase
MQIVSHYKLFATTPKGLELLLAAELRELGATHAAEKLAGVEFSGDLALAYRACLWSRLANRILLQLVTVPAATPEALYAGVQTINWDEHINPEGTLVVNFVCSQSAITHSLFGAQKVKDAIVDQLRAKHNVRPSVLRDQPDVCVSVYLYRDQAAISIDLSGDSLHRRNYRLEAGAAPLKENLAAAILLRSGWPAIAKAGGALLDPMCGSGTFLIEAALMASDTAPGLLRQYFGFLGWKHHQPACWQAIVADAEARHAQGILSLPPISGYDMNGDMIAIAFKNIERAGLLGKVHVEKRELSVFAPASPTPPGLVVVNPPYGERLGELDELQLLYEALGARLKSAFQGWHAAVFTGNPDLGKFMGLRAKRYYALFNGPIPCKLLLFDVTAEKFIDRSPAAINEYRVRDAKRALTDNSAEALDSEQSSVNSVSDGAQMFINRLRKNVKHFGRQARRQGLAAYRVYDADVPEYAFVIDLSEDGAFVREYPAPRTVAAEKVLRRRQEVLALLPEVLNLTPAQIFFNQEPPVSIL